jgi:hypothetical protein
MSGAHSLIDAARQVFPAQSISRFILAFLELYCSVRMERMGRTRKPITMPIILGRIGKAVGTYSAKNSKRSSSL